LHDTATRSQVRFYPDAYYRQLYDSLRREKAISFYVAEAEGQPVAAAVFYDWGGTRHYAHAGAFQDRNRKLKASVSLVWQAMLDAQAAGAHRFDMWGVAPEGDDNHPLAALSYFKKGYGGVPATYGGTWDIPVKRWKYRLYQLYRRLRGRA